VFLISRAGQPGRQARFAAFLRARFFNFAGVIVFLDAPDPELRTDLPSTLAIVWPISAGLCTV
jgi:hypothetical protein